MVPKSSNNARQYKRGIERRAASNPTRPQSICSSLLLSFFHVKKRRFRPRGSRPDHSNREDRENRPDPGRRRGWPRRNDRDQPGRGSGGQGPGRENREMADFWSRLLVSGEDNDFLEKAPCPACGKIPARILGRLGPTLLRKCRSCSLIYISPRLATSVREDMLRREPSPLSSERNLMLRHKMAEHMERMHREMPKVEGMNKRSAALLEIVQGTRRLRPRALRPASLGHGHFPRPLGRPLQRHRRLGCDGTRAPSPGIPEMGA
jgi:hypothetical protein